MAIFSIEAVPHSSDDVTLRDHLREAGLAGLERAHLVRLFLLEGDFARADAERFAHELLIDPVTERAVIREPGSAAELPAGLQAVEVRFRPGVMDPVAESTLAELREAGAAVAQVRTARRYVLEGAGDVQQAAAVIGRALANDCIEEIVPGIAPLEPSPQAPLRATAVRHVSLTELDEGGLRRLSREGHLFLSLEEMRAIQAHFRTLGREPTDLELETLAQTWSEHCVHKTLKSAVEYRGAGFPGEGDGKGGEVERRYENLLRDTIARATQTLIAERRGPECLSVFKDNAGIIGFDEETGVAFKVETHNHPSAIEPYGGAATGVGGCIRDVIGCGLGAQPIANTDVFCVAPGDWPLDAVPKGILHPRRVLRGIVKGVADYGNRMGIPTVNGAVYFDPRYLGNPLVYCGCVGLIPRDRIEKAAQPGDLIVLIGGRTGRDGIHGATFSSAELSDTHADEFSHAVQIGNPIAEKRILDAVMRARDAAGGCLYSAITDCGAGGLSSAVGEMGAEVGAVVHLDRVPLKYAGLRYDEIWISEAQERMVLAVPPEKLEPFMEIARGEEVEATVIGMFGPPTEGPAGPEPRLLVFDHGQLVGELSMRFVHEGLPGATRRAEWRALRSENPPPAPSLQGRGEGGRPDASLRGRRGGGPSDVSLRERGVLEALQRELARGSVASKAWIIRSYDHEVLGGSVIKPLMGPGRGPADAAVLQPRLGSWQGVAIGCGLAPHLSDIDPYWMAVNAIDEAVRNVVCVGGDPSRTAILDNFCWGRTDDPQQMGALVRACQACHDTALAYGTPFISGKDSLNNEFALDAADIEPLLQVLRDYAARDAEEGARLRQLMPELERRLRTQRRLTIPATLLISALSLVRDVRRAVSPDLKQAGNAIVLIGALPLYGAVLQDAARVHAVIAQLIADGVVAACHDVSDGGWLTAIAEMALAGVKGVTLHGEMSEAPSPFGELLASYVVETPALQQVQERCGGEGMRCALLGAVEAAPQVSADGAAVSLETLYRAWSSES